MAHYHQLNRGQELRPLTPASETVHNARRIRLAKKAIDYPPSKIPVPFCLPAFEDVTRLIFKYPISTPAVYKLYIENLLLYVGQSDEMPVRVMSHFVTRERGREALHRGFDKIEAAFIQDEDLRWIWEAWFIWKLQPPANTRVRDFDSWARMPVGVSTDEEVWVYIEKERHRGKLNKIKKRKKNEGDQDS